MIFLSVGTEKYQFNRLLKIIDKAIENNWIEHSVFAQIGTCSYKPKNFPYKDYVSFEEMIKYVENADVLVFHAGVGSTLLALNLGKVPILFPRLKKYGEHVDDHQLDFLKKINSTNKCIVAYDEESLILKIKKFKENEAEISRKRGTINQNDLIRYLKQKYVLKSA